VNDWRADAESHSALRIRATLRLLAPAYAAEMPPLTLIACPVNRAAAGLHKNTASAAMSSAVGTPS